MSARNLLQVFLLVISLSLAGMPSLAEQIDVEAQGSLDRDAGDWILGFFILVGDPKTFGVGSAGEQAAEYSLQSSDPTVDGYWEQVSLFFSPDNQAESSALRTSVLASSEQNAANAQGVFDSLLIDVQDDIALVDGSEIGDAVSFTFSGGNVVFDEQSVIQLSVKLQDSTGTMLDGVGIDQLIDLGLAGTTGASINLLTQTSIVNGTVSEYSSTLVPIPTAAWLFASALGLLGWLRRH